MAGLGLGLTAKIFDLEAQVLGLAARVFGLGLGLGLGRCQEVS